MQVKPICAPGSIPGSSTTEGPQRCGPSLCSVLSHLHSISQRRCVVDVLPSQPGEVKEPGLVGAVFFHGAEDGLVVDAAKVVAHGLSVIHHRRGLGTSMRKHFEVGGASDCIGDALARVVEADDGSTSSAARKFLPAQRIDARSFPPVSRCQRHDPPSRREEGQYRLVRRRRTG
jgi:hypothetical protein